MNQAKLSRAVRMKRMKMRRATTKKKTTPPRAAVISAHQP